MTIFLRHNAFRALAAVAVTALVASFAAAPASAAVLDQSTTARPGIAYAGGTMYLGWAGDDSPSHLNLGVVNFTSSTTSFGVSGVTTFTGDTAVPGTGPAVTAASVPNYSGSQIVMAWAGTDSAHHIYAGHYTNSGTFDCHTQLPESTADSPYLLGLGTTIYLIWRGMDPAHHVNIAPLTTTTCATTGKITLAGAATTLADTTVAGPAITAASGSTIYYAWSATDSANHIYVAQFNPSTGAVTNHTCLCSLASSGDLGMSYNAANVTTIAYRGTDSRVYIAHLKNGTTLYDNQTDGANTTAQGGDITDAPPSNGHYPGGQYNTFQGLDGQVNLDYHPTPLPPA